LQNIDATNEPGKRYVAPRFFMNPMVYHIPSG
jgi:hypothetical protein